MQKGHHACPLRSTLNVLATSPQTCILAIADSFSACVRKPWDKKEVLAVARKHACTPNGIPHTQADAKASVDTLEAVTALALQGCKAAAGAMREALLQHVQSLAMRRGVT